MASRYLDLISQKGTYAIGNLNSQWAKPLANGAKAGENLENFTLVEVTYSAEGERICKYLTDSTKKEGVFLLTAVERRVEEVGEKLSDFYVAKDELTRLHIIEPSLRFETSKFTKAAGVTALKVGQLAYFDAASKGYKIIEAASGASDTAYKAAGIKFTVVDTDTELGYYEDRETIRLEVLSN